MDEVRIESGFTKMILSKILKTVLKKKLGCDVTVELNEFKATIKDGKAHIHVSADGEIDNGDLAKLLKVAGL